MQLDTLSILSTLDSMHCLLMIIASHSYPKGPTLAEILYTLCVNDFLSEITDILTSVIPLIAACNGSFIGN